ncbi:MAG: hypothetical protein AB1344_07420 [Pseudomonadota bacterium]
MNTTFKKTILVAAVAVFCAAPAFASEQSHDSGYGHNEGGMSGGYDKGWGHEEEYDRRGGKHGKHHGGHHGGGNEGGGNAGPVTPMVPIDPAFAVAGTTQSLSENDSYGQLVTNNAVITDNFAQNVQGNLGINTAAGNENAQSNSAALAISDAAAVFGGIAGALTAAEQSVEDSSTQNTGVINNAKINHQSLQNVQGNIGVNVASGNNNAQQNNLAVAVSDPEFFSAAATLTSQTSSGNVTSHSNGAVAYYDTIDVSLSGPVKGHTAAVGVGGYKGQSEGSYYGSEWGSYSGSEWGSYSGDAHGKVKESYGSPCHGSSKCGGYNDHTIAKYEGSEYGTTEGGEAGTYSGEAAGTTHSYEKGKLGFVELGYADLEADLYGTVVTTHWVIQNAENNATLTGNALQNASGNIGVNIASGTGNMQANNLSLAGTCQACQ